MALGPKAMGEAIAANLKAKTGRTLEEWLAVLDAQNLEDKKSELSWLKSQGLGHFQAQLVVTKRNGELLYDNPEQIVDDLFEGYDDQRTLYDAIIAKVRNSYTVTVNPCKGYVPLYSAKNTIFTSIKPTKKGLYIGLVGDDFDFATTQHSTAMGGSERMRHGLYVDDIEMALVAIEASYNNEMKG